MRTKRKPLAEVRRHPEHKTGQKASLKLVVPVGHDMRNARIRKGVDLKKIADETRISLRHLQNLEEGSYSRLPGGMYNRAFIKVYCQYLDLDPTPYLERYEKEVAPKGERPVKPKASETQIADSRGIPPQVVWAVMFMMSVAGLYFSRNWIGEIFAPYFSRPAAASLAPAPPAPKPIQSEVEASNAVLTDTTPSVAQPPPATASADPVAAAEQPPAPLQLRVKVLEECWISVFSDGNSVLVKLLEPGDDQIFGADERFYLILGNAAGVQLFLNGEETRPLGADGEVVKLLINEGNMQDLMLNRTS